MEKRVKYIMSIQQAQYDLRQMFVQPFDPATETAENINYRIFCLQFLLAYSDTRTETMQQIAASGLSRAAYATEVAAAEFKRLTNEDYVGGPPPGEWNMESDSSSLLISDLPTDPIVSETVLETVWKRITRFLWG